MKDCETASETDLFCFQVFVMFFSSSMIKKKNYMLPSQNHYKNTDESSKITKQNNFSIIIYVITTLGEQSTTKYT